MMRSFSHFHDGEFITSRIRLWETKFGAMNGQWTDNEHRIANDQSYLAHLDGTGKPIIKARSRDRIEACFLRLLLAFWAMISAVDAPGI